MSTPNDAGERLHALMVVLADRQMSLSDTEVFDDAIADGIDVRAEASEVRGALLAGLLSAKRQRLMDAQTAHKEAVTSIKATTLQLPRDRAARRALLASALQRRPEMREAMVTLQHRNFDSLSEDDIESALQQLHHLGILDDDLGREK